MEAQVVFNNDQIPANFARIVICARTGKLDQRRNRDNQENNEGGDDGVVRDADSLLPLPNLAATIRLKDEVVMAANYTAVIQQHGEWWIGWVEEVPGVNSQGQTREELLDNLRDALEEALEMNRADARAAVGGAFEEASLPA